MRRDGRVSEGCPAVPAMGDLFPQGAASLRLARIARGARRGGEEGFVKFEITYYAKDGYEWTTTVLADRMITDGEWLHFQEQKIGVAGAGLQIAPWETTFLISSRSRPVVRVS